MRATSSADTASIPRSVASADHRLPLLLGREGPALAPHAPGRGARGVGVEDRPLRDRDHDQACGLLEDLRDRHRERRPGAVEDSLPDHVGGQSGRDSPEGCRAADRVDDADHDRPALGVREAHDRVGEHTERPARVRGLLLLELELLGFEVARHGAVTDQVEGLREAGHEGGLRAN